MVKKCIICNTLKAHFKNKYCRVCYLTKITKSTSQCMVCGKLLGKPHYNKQARLCKHHGKNGGHKVIDVYEIYKNAKVIANDT